jgi:hypothetical protein
VSVFGTTTTAPVWRAAPASGQAAPVPPPGGRPVADLAAALDPAGETLAALLGAAAAGDARARHCAAMVAGTLAELAAGLTADEAVVVFGGHFSCGKSTVLNALLGRELLPTSDFPETGVPCVLRADATDRIDHVTADGRRGELRFSTESIIHLVRLVDMDGEYSDTVHDTAWLAIGLARGGPEPGVIWVDSPGINDTDGMTERAADVAAGADLLVWVVNSRQPMAEVEQAFLREHVARYGPASVLFVVNAFLTAADEADWTRFLTERLGVVRRRILYTELTDPLAPRVIALSARAALANGGGFGVADVRAALTGPSARTRFALNRCHRAERELTELAESVHVTMRDRWLAVAREETVAHAALRRDEPARRQRFRATVDAMLGWLFEQYPSLVDDRARQVARQAGRGVLRHDGTYGRSLTRELIDVGARLADEVISHANRIAADCGLRPLTQSTVDQIRILLRPNPVTVVVPASPPGDNRATTRAAAQADRDATRQQIVDVAAQAAAGLRSRRGALCELVSDPTATELVLPPSNAAASVPALAAVHHHLTGVLLPHATWVREALMTEVSQ